MATDRYCSSCLHDSMDELWFYRNIAAASESDNVTESGSTLSSLSNSDEYTSRQSTPTNIVIGQPLFQLQTAPHPKSRRKARRVKRYKSLSELENYELKGFMDLGFTFPREKLNPCMLSMVPGLQRLKEDERRAVRRPYLSEAWLVNSPQSMINLQMLQKASDGADMKKQIKFWAQRVAMLVQEEP